MVNVYVSLPNDGWIHALSVPLEEIWRLSLRPLKWLRYATFAVLGARGHLLETPGGNIVDYENVSLADGDNYYFSAEGNVPVFPIILRLRRSVKTGGYHLVDPDALNHSSTATSLSERSMSFREKVSLRDNHRCVITRFPARDCVASRIIPHSKSDEVLF